MSRRSAARAAHGSGCASGGLRGRFAVAASSGVYGRGRFAARVYLSSPAAPRPLAGWTRSRVRCGTAAPPPPVRAEYGPARPRRSGLPAPRRRSARAGCGRFAAGSAGVASGCSSLRRGLRRTPRRWGPIDRVLCCVRLRGTYAGPARGTSPRNIRAVIVPPGPGRVRPVPAAAGRRLRPRLRLPQPDATPARPGGDGPAPSGLPRRRPRTAAHRASASARQKTRGRQSASRVREPPA